MSDTIEALRRWIGCERTVQDVLALGPARGMAALLDRPGDWIAPGELLPPLWHWLYLHDTPRQDHLGPDGHERRGDFLPPVPLPRRVWAAGHVRFHRSLLLGAPASRTSSVEAVEEKHGRAGDFILVSVRHRVDGPTGPAVDELQQLAYRPAAQATSPTTAPVDLPLPEWSDVFEATTVALFRFSALTFNAYRIHYDEPYATRAGYPGLVAHAPLLALLLLDAATRRRDQPPAEFEYRALAPAFAGASIQLRGSPDGAATEVWAEADGQVLMRGTVR